MIRIGVIGCGKIAEKHLSAYRHLHDVQVIVTDIVAKGKAIAEQYGVGWCHDPEAIITSADIDVLDVCIPTPSHAQVMLQGLEYGKHIFCEKPFTHTLEEAEQVAARAAEVGRSVMVGYPYRFHPASELTKRILSQGVLGDLHFGLFRIGGRGNHKIWKHLKHTGGGASSEMLVHILDLIVWYFGDIAECQVLYKDILLTERVIEGKRVTPDAEDVILLHLVTSSGLKILCESDLVTPSYMNLIELHGSNGSLVTSIMHEFPTILYCKESRGGYKVGNTTFSFPHVNFFRQELAYFIQSIQDGEKPRLNTVEDSLKVMRLIEKL